MKKGLGITLEEACFSLERVCWNPKYQTFSVWSSFEPTKVEANIKDMKLAKKLWKKATLAERRTPAPRD